MLAALAASLALTVTAAAPGLAKGPRRAALPQTLWVLELDGKGAVGRATLRRYRTHGFNAIVTDARRLSRRRSSSVRRGAAAAQLLKLTSRPGSPASCAAVRRKHGRCVLTASSPAAAMKVARSSAVDLVVVHLRDLGQLGKLSGRPRGRILGLARLDGKRYDARAWLDAVTTAAADSRLDLGVSAVASRRTLAARRFADVMRDWKKRPKPPPPPPQPTPPAPGPPPLPPASVFISPSGTDANPCTQPQPCRSFNRAYRVAASGATVEVAGGTYGGETISPDVSKTSAADVVFRPAAGAAVTVAGEIDANGAHFELRGMTIHKINFPRSADDIILRNVINHGMWMQGASNISILGGEITCGFCGYHPHIQNDGGAPRNILWDGVYFHDWHSVSGEHVECLQILGGDGVTIRNSVFRNCGTGNGGLGATAALHLQAYGTPAPRNILLENNFFYASGNPYVIQGEDFENFDLRYNSLAGPLLLYNGPSAGTGMDFVGNVLKAGPCSAQDNAAPINWRYNVIQGGSCGPTDRNAAGGFVDPSSNLHLAAGSAALNAGDPAGHPARDIDGQNRPLGAAPDAGADEAG
jgi:hypothetical protein